MSGINTTNTRNATNSNIGTAEGIINRAATNTFDTLGDETVAQSERSTDSLAVTIMIICKIMYKDIHFGIVLLIMNGFKAYDIIERCDDLSAKMDNIANNKNLVH